MKQWCHLKYKNKGKQRTHKGCKILLFFRIIRKIKTYYGKHNFGVTLLAVPLIFWHENPFAASKFTSSNLKFSHGDSGKQLKSPNS